MKTGPHFKKPEEFYSSNFKGLNGNTLSLSGMTMAYGVCVHQEMDIAIHLIYTSIVDSFFWFSVIRF